MVAEIIEQKKDEIAALCRKYGVRRLDIFGSAVTEAFDPSASDLDFIVTGERPEDGILYRYVDLADELESLFGRDVDLLTERSIGNPEFRAAVDRLRTPIYGWHSITAASACSPCRRTSHPIHGEPVTG
jgi:predicted nucleotidyltransferase